jgi:hypothetical protein
VTGYIEYSRLVVSAIIIIGFRTVIKEVKNNVFFNFDLDPFRMTLFTQNLVKKDDKKRMFWYYKKTVGITFFLSFHLMVNLFNAR